jgi:putative restriction endonuclease
MTRSLPVRWTRDELLIALNLYHKLTFGLLHSKQPAIITLAEKFGRGSNSVAMKLCNLASLDPALKLRGIKGLEGASKLDREIWQEFYGNPNETIPASEEAVRQLLNVPDHHDLEVIPKQGFRTTKRPPMGRTDVVASVKQRRGQEYFRDAVLNNFGGCCGISQLAIRELLIASHILPWGSHEPERLNVRNGLCLSRLHDAAFDRGLIAFDDNLCLVLSQELKNELPKRAVAENFGAYESAVLQLPSDAVLPEMDFLATHRARIFRK